MDNDDREMLRACLFAQSAMMCALARSHQQPDKLRALFDEEAESIVANYLAMVSSEESREWLDHFLAEYRRHITGDH